MIDSHELPIFSFGNIHNSRLRYSFISVSIISIIFIYNVVHVLGGNMYSLPAHSMHLSGMITLITAIFLSMDLENRYAMMMTQLYCDKTLTIDRVKFLQLHENISTKVAKWNKISAITLMVVVVCGYVYIYYINLVSDIIFYIMNGPYETAVDNVFLLQKNWDSFEGKGPSYFNYVCQVVVSTLVAFVAALIVGFRLGSMAALGEFTTELRRLNGSIRLLPNHPDGTGGVKRLGDLVIYKGIVLLIPILWFTIWISTTIELGGSEASRWDWILPFFFQTLAAMTFVYFGLIRPLISVAKMYGSSKSQLLSLWYPRIEQSLIENIKIYESETDREIAGDAYVKVRGIQVHTNAILKFPRFPTGPWIYRIFTVGTATTLFLLAANIAVEDTNVVKSIINFIVRLFG